MMTYIVYLYENLSGFDKKKKPVAVWRLFTDLKFKPKKMISLISERDYHYMVLPRTLPDRLLLRKSYLMM